MIELQGFYYREGSSAREACRLKINEGGIVTLVDAAGKSSFSTSWQDLEVSSRLGNTPRFITFPQGLRVETQDNDAVDQLVKSFSLKGNQQWLHILETKKRFVAITLVVVVAFVWGMVRYGGPAIADVGSKWVPKEVVSLIGQQSLEALDEFYFSSTQLAPEVHGRVRAHFEPLFAQHPQLDLKLVFRANEDQSPNAFALPDGTLVFTDAMVQLAQEDDELLAVAAHEVGHVEYRHSLRRMIQGSVLAFMLAIVAGDISGTSEFFLGIPVMLTELSYSRDFEREADSYAIQWLQKNGKSPQLFASIMNRLEASRKCKPGEKDCKRQRGESHKWLDYFSTHPPTDERIDKAVNGAS